MAHYPWTCLRFQCFCPSRVGQVCSTPRYQVAPHRCMRTRLPWMEAGEGFGGGSFHAKGIKGTFVQCSFYYPCARIAEHVTCLLYCTIHILRVLFVSSGNYSSLMRCKVQVVPFFQARLQAPRCGFCGRLVEAIDCIAASVVVRHGWTLEEELRGSAASGPRRALKSYR